MRCLGYIFLSLSFANVYAFNWTDLWHTQNQQAQIKMNKGQFKEAEATFKNPDWRATAAYRAGNFGQALKHYSTLQNEFGFYNKGNALAHLGKYEEAIKAYNAALAINPKHQDALYNRKLVQDLLKKKKEEQNQNQQGQNQQNKDQQNQQDKNQQDQNQKNQGQQNKEQQGQNQENKDQQNSKNQGQQKKEQQNQKDKDQQGKEQQPKAAKPEPKEADKMQSAEKLEKQQAKEQWLRLIPDDPAGLMREKFLRDHLRREEGWYQ